MRRAIFLLVFAVAVCAFGAEPESGLPSRNPAKVVPLLQALPTASTYGDVCGILGKPNLQMGTGVPDAIFILDDESRVHVTTRIHLPDFVYRVQSHRLVPAAPCRHSGRGQNSLPRFAENLAAYAYLEFPWFLAWGRTSHDSVCSTVLLPCVTLCSMESESFDRSLRAFSRRTPFQTFAVELTSGARITVDHPEALVYRGGLAVYIAPDGTPTLFDHAGVTQLTGVPDKESAAAS